MTPASADTVNQDEGAEADGRARRWEGHTAQRRQQILDAAIDLIQTSGSAVSVRDIADHAQIPRSVVYRIFQDGADLDEQVREEIVGQLMSVIAPALEPDGTIQESIDLAVTTYVDWVTGYPLLHQFLGTGSSKRRTTGSRVVTGTRTAIALQLTGLVSAVATKAGADPGVGEPLAFGVVGLVDGSVNRWVNNTATRVPAALLATFLSESIWAVLSSQSATLGLTLTPTTRISDLL